MTSDKIISPLAILALKEALSLIYHKKEDLRDFMKLSLVNNSIVSTLSWEKTKREICKELIERMTNRLDLYKDDLKSLILTVSSFEDFTHLKFWDDDGSKTKRAKEGVNKLKELTKGHLQLSKDEEEARKRRIASEKEILKNRTLNEELANLSQRFNLLVTLSDKQKRGFALEKFLFDLFLLYELDPKGSFKNNGEQIDGAFTFQGNDYLIEAKWKQQVNRNDIAYFCNKIQERFKTSIGLLVTIDGVTRDAISPIFQSIIIMDGFDITTILEGRISLTDLLLKKRRKATETGNIYLNINQL